MEAKLYNFWSLTNDYCLDFPRIQRDYAQGRLTFKASQVRRAFIQSLDIALKKDIAAMPVLAYELDENGIMKSQKAGSTESETVEEQIRCSEKK